MSLAVFLLDDDVAFRNALCATLFNRLQAKVVGRAETSDAALLWFALHEWQWDLAVLDLFLEEGTAYEVLARMAPSHRRRCVVLTNTATPANIAQCFELGVDAVFDKAFQIDDFIDYCAQLPAAQMVT